MYYFETFERKQHTKRGQRLRLWWRRRDGLAEREREKNDSVLFNAFEMTKQNRANERTRQRGSKIVSFRSQRLRQLDNNDNGDDGDDDGGTQ